MAIVTGSGVLALVALGAAPAPAAAEFRAATTTAGPLDPDIDRYREQAPRALGQFHDPVERSQAITAEYWAIYRAESAANLVSEIDADEWGTQASDSVRWRRLQQARQRLEVAIGAIRAIPEHATFLRQPEDRRHHLGRG